MKVIGTAEATAVIADYFDLICDTDYAFDESEILRRMNANAVDAEPVRRGKWIWNDKCRRVCSVCENPVAFMLSMDGWHEGKYCPNCGARMDKDD